VRFESLLFVIVGLNWLTILTILLIWLPRTIISSPTWKKKLSGKRYQSDDKVTSAVENYFEGQKETFLKNLKGDYVEK